MVQWGSVGDGTVDECVCVVEPRGSEGAAGRQQALQRKRQPGPAAATEQND